MCGHKSFVCVILITFPPTTGKMRLHTSVSIFWHPIRSPKTSGPFLALCLNRFYLSLSPPLILSLLVHSRIQPAGSKKSNNVHQPARSGLTFCQTAYHTLLITQAGHTDSPTAKMLPLTQASCNVSFQTPPVCSHSLLLKCAC